MVQIPRFHFNLRSKLTLTYLAVGLALVMSNVLSAHWLQRRWQRVTIDRAETVRSTEELSSIANSAFEEGFAYVLSGDEQEKAGCLHALELFGERHRRVIERAHSRGDASVFLAPLRDAHERAVQSASNMFAEYETAGYAGVPAYKAYETAMDALSGSANAAAEVAREQAVRDDTGSSQRLNETLFGIGLVTAIVAIGLGSLFGHHLTRPLVRLRDVAVRFGQGELDILHGEHSNDEIGEVSKAFADMGANIRKLLSEVAAQKQQLEDIFGSLGEMLLVCGHDGKITAANRAAYEALGYASKELLGKDLGAVIDSVDVENLPQRRSIPTGDVRDTDLQVLRKDGRRLWVSVSTSPLRSGENESGGLVCVVQDLSEQRRLEAELRQSQKLEAIGRLAAGIGHEINTPVQFVGDSLHFVTDATGELFAILQAYQNAQLAIAQGVSPNELLARARALEEEMELPYLLENLPDALARARGGLDRIATIVRSMKIFAHPEQAQMAAVDLNQAVEATLTVAGTEYRDTAELRTDLADLPPVVCHVGEVNQAVLNLVVNAAHAIADKPNREGKGVIGVQTRRDGEAVVVSISDTGGGIPAEIRDRIFEPFFTTKEVGRGTGQGLSVTYAAIVERHGGQLDFETEVGVGTTFHIRLLIDGPTTSSSAKRQPGAAA